MKGIDKSRQIMPFFEKYGQLLGITEKNFTTKVSELQLSCLSKGLIKEIYKLMLSITCGMNWKILHQMLKCPECVSVASFRRSAEYIFHQARKLRRDELDAYLAQAYEWPKPKFSLTNTNTGRPDTDKLKSIQCGADTVLTNNNGAAQLTNEAMAMNEVISDLGKENAELRKEINQLQQKMEKTINENREMKKS